MKAKLLKTGNWFAIKIPKRVITEARLHADDVLNVLVREEGLIELSRADSFPSLEELVSQITPENRYAEISTAPSVGRENDI